jgi:hypothetical protein
MPPTKILDERVDGAEVVIIITSYLTVNKNGHINKAD